MRVRQWKPGLLLAILVPSWSLALLLGAIADETNAVQPAAGAVVLAVVPTVLATIWSWNRLEVGTWHVGKVVMLWALFLLAIYWFRRMERGLEVIPIILAGIPLLVLSWAWFSGRERA